MGKIDFGKVGDAIVDIGKTVIDTLSVTAKYDKDGFNVDADYDRAKISVRKKKDQQETEVDFELKKKGQDLIEPE